MRQVDRASVEAPRGLIGDDSSGAREIERAGNHVNEKGKISGFTFRAYKRDDVRHALDALFHGKCAYCESRYDVSGPVDIEHYRPKGEVDEDENHPGYWWLAATWDNLLPSCLDCNRRRFQSTPANMSSVTALATGQLAGDLVAIKTGKNSVFPITGSRAMDRATGTSTSDLEDEAPLLLHPCNDAPSEHLRFYIAEDGNHIGLVLARANPSAVGAGELPEPNEDPDAVEQRARDAGISARGAVSIQVYGLNRLALVQERTRLLYHLDFLGDTLLQCLSVVNDLKTVQATTDQGQGSIDTAIVVLNNQCQRIMQVIHAAAKDDSPFSTMVSTWLNDFTTDFED